jgi:uroporphyrinogen-III synthase
MTTNQATLDGLRVLVTRPEQRAGTFVGMLQAAGAEAMTFPVITITEPLSPLSREDSLKNIARYQMAIFISPTAVEKTFEHIDVLPDTLKLVALGKSTARALKVLDYTLSFEADTQDSESLLSQPRMQAEQVAQQNIVIFRGEGGRNLLADTLRERGAQVVYADIYRRTLPTIEHLQTEQLSNLHAVCVTSNQSLQNLIHLCDDVALLKTLPLFVPGHRCADLAQALGFDDVHMASSATDDAMLEALVKWAKQR